METSLVNLKREVFYSYGGPMREQRLSSYTDALYNAFVIVQKVKCPMKTIKSLVLMIA